MQEGIKVVRLLENSNLGVRRIVLWKTNKGKNSITNNAAAFQGPVQITSAKNNSVTGNAAQGLTPTVVPQQ